MPTWTHEALCLRDRHRFASFGSLFLAVIEGYSSSASAEQNKWRWSSGDWKVPVGIWPLILLHYALRLAPQRNFLRFTKGANWALSAAWSLKAKESTAVEIQKGCNSGLIQTKSFRVLCLHVGFGIWPDLSCSMSWTSPSFDQISVCWSRPGSWLKVPHNKPPFSPWTICWVAKDNISSASARTAEVSAPLAGPWKTAPCIHWSHYLNVWDETGCISDLGLPGICYAWDEWACSQGNLLQLVLPPKNWWLRNDRRRVPLKTKLNSLLLNLSSALDLLTPCWVRWVLLTPQIACSLEGRSEKKGTLVHEPRGIESPNDQAWVDFAGAWIGRFPKTETDPVDSDVLNLWVSKPLAQTCNFVSGNEPLSLGCFGSLWEQRLNSAHLLLCVFIFWTWLPSWCCWELMMLTLGLHWWWAVWLAPPVQPTTRPSVPESMTASGIGRVSRMCFSMLDWIWANGAEETLGWCDFGLAGDHGSFISHGFTWEWFWAAFCWSTSV